MLARDYRISFGLNEIKVQQFDDIDGISHNQSLFDKSWTDFGMRKIV